MVYISKGKLEIIDDDTIVVVTPQERIRLCGVLKDLWLSGMCNPATPEETLEDRVLFLEYQGLVEINRSNVAMFLVLNQIPVPTCDDLELASIKGLNENEIELYKWISNGQLRLLGYEYVSIYCNNISFELAHNKNSFIQDVCSVLYSDSNACNETQNISDILSDKEAVKYIKQYVDTLASLLKKQLVYIL